MLIRRALLTYRRYVLEPLGQMRQMWLGIKRSYCGHFSNECGVTVMKKRKYRVSGESRTWQRYSSARDSLLSQDFYGALIFKGATFGTSAVLPSLKSFSIALYSVVEMNWNTYNLLSSLIEEQTRSLFTLFLYWCSASKQVSIWYSVVRLFQSLIYHLWTQFCLNAS